MERIDIGDKIEFTRNLEGVYWEYNYDKPNRKVFQIETGDKATYLGNSAITITSGQSAGQRMLLEISAPVRKIS